MGGGMGGVGEWTGGGLAFGGCFVDDLVGLDGKGRVVYNMHQRGMEH